MIIINSFKQLKIGDFIVPLILLIISFFPYVWINTKANNVSNSKNHNLVAIVQANNHTIKRLPLNKNQVWTYSDHGQINTVEVRENRVRIVDANCKDQICVKQGWKDKNGQTIICLPHKFLIEIKNMKESKSSNSNDFDHTLVKP